MKKRNFFKLMLVTSLGFVACENNEEGLDQDAAVVELSNSELRVLSTDITPISGSWQIARVRSAAGVSNVSEFSTENLFAPAASGLGEATFLNIIGDQVAVLDDDFNSVAQFEIQTQFALGNRVLLFTADNGEQSPIRAFINNNGTLRIVQTATPEGRVVAVFNPIAPIVIEDAPVVEGLPVREASSDGTAEAQGTDFTGSISRVAADEIREIISGDWEITSVNNSTTAPAVGEQFTFSGGGSLIFINELGDTDSPGTLSLASFRDSAVGAIQGGIETALETSGVAYTVSSPNENELLFELFRGTGDDLIVFTRL